MRKKIFMLGLSLCLFAAACNGKNAAEENTQNQGGEESTEPKNANSNGDIERDESGGGKESSGKESSGNKDGDDSPSPVGELSKVPEVTYTDYSREIQEEDSDVTLLSVTENCPVITIEENEEAARKMNLVFEQQHETNQEDIKNKIEEAKSDYHGLSKEEAKAWQPYGYGISYKVVSASTRILSIEAESYDWQGGSHPNTWTSAYCFDAASGDLLYLADIFTDEEKARKVVEEHILDTITKKPYKDALLDDYEDYVADILTENTFYLNEKGLVVICNPYMVATHAAATIEIEVPYAKLKDMMNENYILK